jgi:hypothetical protein
MTTPSLTERFAAQLRERLAGMEPSERGRFLRELLDSWINREDRFHARVARGRLLEADGGVTAFDYASTIAEIQIAIGQHERADA